MLNLIVDGIYETIYDEFGSDYAIYTESIEEELKVPCFTIFMVSMEQERLLNTRRSGRYQMCVRFYPETVKRQYECGCIAGRLAASLEEIMIDDDLIRGSGIKAELMDDGLSCMVTYTIITNSIAEVEMMGTATISSNLKE